MNAFKLFKNYIYSDKKWNYHEDNIWSILVNKLATTKLCVRKVIYKYNYSNNSLLNNRYNPTELNNIIINSLLNKCNLFFIFFLYINLLNISFVISFSYLVFLV